MTKQILHICNYKKVFYKFIQTRKCYAAIQQTDGRFLHEYQSKNSMRKRRGGEDGAMKGVGGREDGGV